jgi:hypothetical protein
MNYLVTGNDKKISLKSTTIAEINEFSFIFGPRPRNRVSTNGRTAIGIAAATRHESRAA